MIQSSDRHYRADKSALYYWIFAAFVAVAVMFLHPIDDDWFFLRYFDADTVNRWGVNRYRWIGDCRLLMRDYWRPIEDLLMTFEASYAPWLFPHLQHALIVALVFGCGWSVRSLGIMLGVPPVRMTMVVGAGMLMATNTGAITSIDSLTQVSAAFWGLMSTRVYMSRSRWRRVLWVASCLLACLSKESGFVFVIAGPAMACVAEAGNGAMARRIRLEWRGIMAAGLIIAAYLGTYAAMRHFVSATSVPSDFLTVEKSLGDVFSSLPDSLSQSTFSHEVTPVTFVKNIAILYGLGIYPVAVSGLYYGNHVIVLLTLLIGWGGVVLLYRMWRAADAPTRQRFLLTALLAFWISAPSLVTRAGEISPFNSNMVFLVAIGVLAARFRFRRSDLLFLGLFATCAFVTDGYKYSLALRGGLEGRRLAAEAVRLTPSGAKSVLWVGVDEYGRDKSGASYTMSPYRAFYQGSAAISAMDYPADLTLTRYIVADGPGAETRADSIARARAGEYDCVWLTSGNEITVIAAPTPGR